MLPLDLLEPEPAGRFSGEPERNAFVELHNAIVAAGSVRDVGPSDRVRISRQRGVDLARAFRPERQALYQRALQACLANGDLDADDRRLLDHLARTLALTAADLRSAHQRAFGTIALDAIADSTLSTDERLLLFKLQHVLGLDPRLADGAYSVLAREHLVRLLAERLVDGGLSPDDEAEVLAVARRLSLDLTDDLRTVLERSRARWQVHNGPLVTVDVPVTLPAGEAGRAAVPGHWSAVDGPRFERAVGADILAAGRTGGLRMPRAALRGGLRQVRIVLTDRRILLRPARGIPEEVPLKRVVQILRFRDGTVVRTAADRYVFLDPGADNDAFYAVLHRTLFRDRRAAPD